MPDRATISTMPTQTRSRSRALDLIIGKPPRKLATRAPEDFAADVTPPARTPASSTTTATVAESFTLSQVYRGIQIHAFAAKQLSIATLRGDEPIEDHPVVSRPDAEMSRSAWIEQVIVSLASTGNAYLEIMRNGRDEVVSLPVLNPLDMRVNVSSSGRTTGYEYRGTSFTPNRIKHLKLLRVPGARYGLGPIQAANGEIRGAIDTRDYSSHWVRSGGQPNGILKSESVLSPDQAKAYKEQWNETAGAMYGPVVLGQGLSYQPIFLTPKDVQFLETRNFDTLGLARLLGVPSSLMLAAVEGSSQTYQNVEQEWIAYVRFTLMGYLVEIEDALSTILPGKQRARFNVEALLRTDTQARYAAHEIALRAGFMTVPEVRKLERLPELDELPVPIEQENSNAAA